VSTRYTRMSRYQITGSCLDEDSPGSGFQNTGSSRPTDRHISRTAYGQQCEGFRFYTVPPPAGLFRRHHTAAAGLLQVTHQRGVVAPSAAGDEFDRHFRELAETGGNCAGGKGRQGCSAILEGQAAGHVCVEIIAVQ